MLFCSVLFCLCGMAEQNKLCLLVILSIHSPGISLRRQDLATCVSW